MASVYLARQQAGRGFERLVALKQTHAHLREQSEWVSELIEEAKLASRIVHPNVVQVLDVDDDEAGVFLVMQYVEGDTLAGLFRHASKTGERIPMGIAVRVMADALLGLHAAHELRDERGHKVGLVHRDFSPQNVLVGIDGISRLTDFGVAKAADRVGFTRTGTIKGKFGYMSPEQVKDEPLDARSDVFSAGVVAWELLAGQRMYPSGDQTSTLLRIVTEPARRLSTVVPSIPPELDDAVASALAIKRDQRCPSAEAFRERLLAAYREVDEVPDASEVAAYVRAVAGTKLAERRAKCDEVIALRARMSELVGVPESLAPTPSPARAAAPALEEGSTQTEASVASDTQRAAQGKRGVYAAVGLAAVATLAVATFVVNASLRAAPETKTDLPSSVPSASSATLAPASSVTFAAPPNTSPNVSPPDAIADASAPVASARAPSHGKPANSQAGRGTPTPSASASSAPAATPPAGLLRNPYEGEAAP